MIRKLDSNENQTDDHHLNHGLHRSLVVPSLCNIFIAQKFTEVDKMSNHVYNQIIVEYLHEARVHESHFTDMVSFLEKYLSGNLMLRL